MIKKIAKYLISSTVDIYARFFGYNFPAKYGWRWKLLMLRGRYEPETTKAFKQILKPGMTAIDIGAHIGYFTRLSAKLVGTKGRVLAFEPEPENYALLSGNTGRFSNVEIFNLALADKKGEMPFYKSTGKTGSHSLVRTDARAMEITVSVETLDDFLVSRSITRVDFVKMDIEGAEPLALAGMKKTLEKNPGIKIIMEFCTDHLRAAGFDPSEVLRSLHAQGFSCRSIEDDQPVSANPESIAYVDEKPNSTVNLLVSKISA